MPTVQWKKITKFILILHVNFTQNLHRNVEENHNNRTKYIFFNLRKCNNRNNWENYVTVTRVELSVELDVLIMR